MDHRPGFVVRILKRARDLLGVGDGGLHRNRPAFDDPGESLALD